LPSSALSGAVITGLGFSLRPCSSMEIADLARSGTGMAAGLFGRRRLDHWPSLAGKAARWRFCRVALRLLFSGITDH